MWNIIKEKLKSWALWVSLGALAIFIAKTFFKVEIGETVDGLLNVLCPVLVGFGIVNNPNSRNSL